MMAIRRVALVFEDRARPETTGVYCRRALEQLVDVAHFRPDELAQIPREGIDLYLNIDDGFQYVLPSELRPQAWWAIDTHLNFERCQRKARDFDVVFAAQRDGVAALRQAGITSARWLPLACDPDIHRKHDVAKQYDVAFVGNVFPGPREEFLDLIRRKYRNAFIGQCYFDDMAKTYSAARTVFNRSITNDVNMRVFEALACGSLLLTNDLTENGQTEMFRDGVHLATYRDADDLLDKLAYYLKREALREKIAAAGAAEAASRHTYRHRMERLLSAAQEALARKAICVGSAEPANPNTNTGGIHPPYDSSAESKVGMRGWRALAGTEAVPTGQTHQDPTYFSYGRPEILGLIPDSASRVLDIGCGAGRLGEALKARQQAAVVGLELNEEAARLAGERLDRVLIGDVEQLTPDFDPASFEAIICGDILEHLREPERLLRQARQWLTPDGCLVASIPNIRHHSVVCSLLEGNWTYESPGLLDRTHLRFFTRREIEKLFVRAGFTIESMWSIAAPADDPSENGQGSVQLGRLSMSGLSTQDAAEFYAYQYLVRARPAVPCDFGLTSIIIVTHNQLEYTRQCLESIRRLTDEPYELIAVDNASTDGTVDYLRATPQVRLITNDANHGFPAAVNQGIQVASGRQILLLNNDTVVTTGWLGRLLRALYRDPQIGLVGPCSNCVSGPQQVEGGYDNLAQLDGFAWEWGKGHEGVHVEINRLVGFCLLIRREVIGAVGLLDERFGIGCFEDDDYCLRTIQAGYRAVIAVDAFVHHYGGRTFLGTGVDCRALMAENQRRFQDKWSSQGANGTPVPESDAALGADRPERSNPDLGANGTGLRRRAIEWPESRSTKSGQPTRQLAVEIVPGGGLRLKRSGARRRISLCMIVRDNARTLPACLESIRPWVDEMVVVDTGSVDETPRIVEAYGGRLFHFPWCDDFSAARNESLRHAQGEWLFWMNWVTPFPGNADAG
jgi:GT2 family glycosyltransferase/2-polyprenyl-3-methyl-5-hydroxy-6-metoxy-1,4-benzoquinol methylase